LTRITDAEEVTGSNPAKGRAGRTGRHAAHSPHPVAATTHHDRSRAFPWRRGHDRPTVRQSAHRARALKAHDQWRRRPAQPSPTDNAVCATTHREL